MNATPTIADFQVTGMTCGHCEMSVREEIEELAGVSGITVSAQTGTLRVETDGTVSDEAITAAVTEAGYSAVRV